MMNRPIDVCWTFCSPGCACLLERTERHCKQTISKITWPACRNFTHFERNSFSFHLYITISLTLQAQRRTLTLWEEYQWPMAIISQNALRNQTLYLISPSHMNCVSHARPFFCWVVQQYHSRLKHTKWPLPPGNLGIPRNDGPIWDTAQIVGFSARLHAQGSHQSIVVSDATQGPASTSTTTDAVAKIAISFTT